VTTTLRTTDEAQIRQVVGALAIAMLERDPEQIISRYAPGVVKFDLAPPLRRVGAEVHDIAGLQAWFSGFDGPIDYEIRDLELVVGDDVAFCHSLNRMSATPHGAQQGFDLWIRATVCLQKLDGSWLITHEHTSTPFYMDGSFKAAVDLTP
jgi:ketosteroid isomerase-like protein